MGVPGLAGIGLFPDWTGLGDRGCLLRNSILFYCSMRISTDADQGCLPFDVMISICPLSILEYNKCSFIVGTEFSRID